MAWLVRQKCKLLGGVYIFKLVVLSIGVLGVWVEINRVVLVDDCAVWGMLC